MIAAQDSRAAVFLQAESCNILETLATVTCAMIHVCYDSSYDRFGLVQQTYPTRSTSSAK